MDRTAARNLGQTFAALAVGFFVPALLSRTVTDILQRQTPGSFDRVGRTQTVWVLLVMLSCSAIFGILGSYLAAQLAPRRPMFHALLLGMFRLTLILLLPLLLLIGADLATPWYHVADAVLALPCAWLGGFLWIRTRGGASFKEPSAA